MSAVVQLGWENSAAPFQFTYVNHAGVEGKRTVLPMGFFFGVSKYYTEPQWLLEAWDMDKQALRHYSLSKINVAEEKHKWLEKFGDIPPYQQRLLIEAVELYEKIQKLDAYQETAFFSTLVDTQRELLKHQRAAMMQYYSILIKRLGEHGLQLNGDEK